MAIDAVTGQAIPRGGQVREQTKITLSLRACSWGVKVGILFINEKPRCWVSDQSKPFDRTQTVVTRMAPNLLEAFYPHSIMRQGCEWEWLGAPGQPVLHSLRDPIGSPPQ